MTDWEIRDRLRVSLMRASTEHGTPSVFKPGELHALYGGPRPMDAGRVARRYPAEVDYAGRGWGVHVSYDEHHRVFYVSPRADAAGEMMQGGAS